METSDNSCDSRWFFAIESSGDGVWDWNFQTGAVFYSSSWKSMLGYKDDEIKNRLSEWKRRVHPDDLNDIRRALTRCIKGKTPRYECQHRLLCKNGKYKWILTRGRVVEKTADGKPLRIVGTHTDISETKRIELELTMSKEKKKALINNLPILAWMKDKEGKFEVVNNMFTEFFGLNESEIIGKTADEFLTKNIADFYFKDDEEIINSGGRKFHEDLIVTESGEKWIETHKSTLFGSDGEAIGITGFFRDISERKKMETELRRKDKVLFAVAMSIEQLFYSDSVDETIPFCLEEIGKSAGADRVYLFRNYNADDGNLFSTQTDEWTKDGVPSQMGSPYTTYIPLDSVPELLNAGIRKRIFSGIVSSFTSQLKDALEPQGIKSIMIIPIHLNNQFWGFVGFDDCTKERIWSEAEKNILSSFASALGVAVQRELAAEELKIARSSANAANVEKSRFLANVSHELRTPLNAIIGISKMLAKKESENLSARQNEGLNLINESGNRLLLLINDILDIAKIEAGKMEFNPSMFDLKKLVSQQVEILKTLTAEKQIDIEYVFGDNVPVNVNSDFSKVTQILTNICGNSAKYTDKGSIKITVESDSLNAVITVEDTGEGIEASEIDKVFDQFYQIAHPMTKKHSGSGLGLPLSKKMADLIGGSIVLSSVEGVGTKVIFSFPYGEGASWNSIETADKADVPEYSDKRKIYIVDDEKINRMTFSLMLESRYDLRFAFDGKMFLNEVSAWTPDIVLMDIMMPELDGFETLRLFRRMKQYDSIPVIAVTARAMEEEKSEILDKGFSGYVSKPVDDQILINLIERMCANDE
ncbi:MAG TPA: PAS domain S-box protein [Spirochaetota bacterium]|nr:PAS domain S-box protein [Spirochaetota bacterium]